MFKKLKQRLVNEIAAETASRVNGSYGEFLPPIQINGTIFWATTRGQMFHVVLDHNGYFTVQRIGEVIPR